MTSPTPRAAIYTGSFDPLTFGHLDVIRQGAELFDRIVVAIGVHPGKAPLLSFEERAELIRGAEMTRPSSTIANGLPIF